MQFTLTSEYIQLNQLLKITGLCDTGGEANHCIVQGEVMVNQMIETRKRKKISPGDMVTFRNQTIEVVS